MLGPQHRCSLSGCNTLRHRHSYSVSTSVTSAVRFVEREHSCIFQSTNRPQRDGASRTVQSRYSAWEVRLESVCTLERDSQVRHAEIPVLANGEACPETGGTIRLPSIPAH